MAIITLHTKVNRIALDGFMQDFIAKTEPNMFGSYERVWERKCRFALDVWNDGIYIQSIETIFRGCGDGTRGLCFIRDLAKFHSITLEGCVQAFASEFGPPGLSNKHLAQWYARHGFEVYTKGSETYIRYGETK